MASSMLRMPTTAVWGYSTTCSCSLPPVATAPIVARAVCRRGGRRRVEAGAAVLERTERIEELQPAGYELYTDTDMDLSEEFAEYKRATQQLDDLADLQALLMDSVQTMDNMLQTPQPQVTDTPEARRAKRQQSRAARRGPTTSMSAATVLEVQPALHMGDVSLASTSAAQQMSPAPVKAKRTAKVPASTAPATQLAVASPVSQPSLLPGSTLSLSRPSTQAWAATSLAVSAGPSLTASSGSTARHRHQARASRNATKRESLPPEVVAELTSGRASSTSSSDGTTQFMKAAATNALLKPEQQKEVATVVKDFLRLKSIEKELHTILKRPPTMAEWARAAKADNTLLFQARLRQGQDAKALMLKSNYRLVIKVVKAYQNRGMSLQDLIAEGMQGLLRGVEKFEVDKGFRFSTYAHWWIRQAVTRALQDQGRAVRLPTHIHEQITRITIVKQQLHAKLGRMPTMMEISEQIGIPADKIPEILAASHQINSLESPVAGDEDGGMEVKDTLADDRDQPDDVFADDMIRENINEVLRTLNPREAGVLRMHWGLDGHSEMTLEEIGAHFKITRERVRQLEARAMRLLKEHQNKLQGVMHELQHTSVYEIETEGRSSRGTRKS